MPRELPIFPLSTVLFPDGVLPLRIFEARYMDMARDCLKHDLPFGVCLITHGGEVGQPAEHEAVGCLAHIRDWDMQQLGLLQVRTVGGQRFKIQSRRTTPAGLILASTTPLTEDPVVAVSSTFDDCQALMRRIIDEVCRQQADPQQRMIAEPFRVESAGWLANRLAECLPMPGPLKHRLMAGTDPIERLTAVQTWLRQQRVI